MSLGACAQFVGRAGSVLHLSPLFAQFAPTCASVAPFLRDELQALLKNRGLDLWQSRATQIGFEFSSLIVELGLLRPKRLPIFCLFPVALSGVSERGHIAVV